MGWGKHCTTFLPFLLLTGSWAHATYGCVFSACCLDWVPLEFTFENAKLKIHNNLWASSRLTYNSQACTMFLQNSDVNVPFCIFRNLNL